MRLPFTAKSVDAKTIAQMVGGVDYFVIGITLLVFGYGIVELVISYLIHAWRVVRITPTSSR